MKKQILLIVMVIISMQCFPQTYDWLWAQNSGGPAGDYAYSLKEDDNGNIFVTGSFKSATITFGNFILTNTNEGTNDIFLVKYNSNKDVVWAISDGGSGSDVASCVDVDAAGNIYIGGYFYSSVIDFGGNITVTNDSPGYSNILVVKYDINGNALLARTASGSHNEELEDIDVDVNGNIFIVGYFESSTCTFGTFPLINSGYYDGFLVKYDASGDVIYADAFGGSMWDNCKGVITDNSGNLYVTGFYRSDITFGDTTLLNNTGDAHIFAVKYNSSLECLWVRNSTGTWEIGNEIALDNSGGVYITGFFQGTTMSCGSLWLSNNGPSGTSDFYIVKYDQEGSPQWLTGGGNTEYEEGRCIETDDNGNVFAGVYFSSSSITLGATTISNFGAGDVLLIKYLPDGSFSWVLNAGGDSDDHVYSLISDENNKVYVCGSFSSTTTAFGGVILTNSGTADLFIAEAGDVNTQINPEISQYKCTVLPNPAKDFLSIKTGSEMIGSDYSLINSTGVQVLRGILNNENITLNVSHLKSGIYYLVFPDMNSIIRKIIIQRD